MNIIKSKSIAHGYPMGSTHGLKYNESPGPEDLISKTPDQIYDMFFNTQKYWSIEFNRIQWLISRYTNAIVGIKMY